MPELNPPQGEEPIEAIWPVPSGIPAPPVAPQADRAAAPAGDPQATRHALTPERLARQAEEHRRMVGAAHVPPRRRGVVLPLALFLLTCASTFYVAATNYLLESSNPHAAIMRNWANGLIYMTCVLAILLTHEMGHFLMTLRYRIASTYPFFIPFPLGPTGTMGAVIAMDGLSADRKQMFDIGLAGPIAGLVVALPIMWYGVTQLDLRGYEPSKIDRHVGQFSYHLPWVVQEMVAVAQPKGYVVTTDAQGRQLPRPRANVVTELPTTQLNPFFMAGWVGLLITGLNMLPISQLDGGHVIYALFGKWAHVIARFFLFGAIFLVVVNFEHAKIWIPMLILVTLIGTDHPPTADDRVPLGLGRTLLGLASLAIPLLCFPAYGLRMVGM